MTLHIRVGGVWREVMSNAHLRLGGSWRNIEQGHIRIGGTWHTFYQRDTQGPASPTIVRASWRNGNQCRVTWTNPADADYAYMEIRRHRDGLGWDPQIIKVNAPTGSYDDLNIPDFYRIYTYMLTPYDTVGNAGNSVIASSMGWTGRARGRQPSPRVFYPTDSGAWLSATGWYDEHPAQGSSTFGNHFGAYFYGDVPRSSLLGAVVSSMSVLCYRYPEGGKPDWVQPSLWYSTMNSKASSPQFGTNTFAGPVLGSGVCRDTSCPKFTEVALPFSHWDAFFKHDTEHVARSLVFYSNDTTLQAGNGNLSWSFARFYRSDWYPENMRPGRITIVHGG